MVIMSILNVMSTKYKAKSTVCPRVQDMPTVAATTLKNSTADVLDQVIGGQPMAVTRHDKPRAVLISMDLYDSLMANQDGILADLRQHYGKMLDDMQSPEQKAAARRAFEATPEELGAAALRAAQEKAKYNK